MAELNSKENFKGTVSNASINFNDNSYTDSSGVKHEGQNLGALGFEITQEASYVSGSMEAQAVPTQYLGGGSKLCYPSAALLELLLQLTNRMYIEGGMGWRAIIGPNFSTLSAENHSVSDHAFGRGFDIMPNVGTSAAQKIPTGVAVDNYRKALDCLLTNLQTISWDLHPDLIVIHDQLRSEFGIEDGLENANSAIRLKYPKLAPFVNFGVDSSHRNHIHISFSPQRAGSFITPEIASELTGMPLGGNTGSTNVDVDKFKNNYKGKVNESLTPDEVMALLSTSGMFSPEMAAIFTAISVREGSSRPAALNLKTSGGDFSVTMFQITLLPGGHGPKKFVLKYPSDDSVLGYKLGYSVDSDNDPTSLSKKLIDLGSEQTIDSRVFIPYNQALMLGTAAAGEVQAANAIKNNKPLNSYLFAAWGDYEWKGKSRSTVGFIFNIKFATAVSAYQSVGGSIDGLKTWVREKFKNQKPYPYIEKWMAGTEFDDQGNEV